MVYCLVRVLLILCVREKLCDVHIRCQESHYAVVLDNSLLTSFHIYQDAPFLQNGNH